MDRASHPWVLIVDADERVTAELSREILDLLAKGPDADHYYVRRQNIFGRSCFREVVPCPFGVISAGFFSRGHSS